jgi:signal transduction histidine kinase
MRRLIPRSLSGQTLAVLILGLALSHFIGIALYSFDREEAVISAEGVDFADRVAGVVNLLELLPEQWRHDVVAGSDGRKFHVALGKTAAAEKWDTGGALARSVRAYLQRQLPDRSADRFVVSFTESAAFRDATARGSPAMRAVLDAAADGTPHDILTISVRLDDTVWLNVVGAIPKPAAAGFLWAGAYILTVAVGIGAVSIWLVWRVAAPLTAFARAADRLGKNIRAEPLPEEGPVEVAQASKAFNAMQERLRRLVENRTQLLAAVSHDLRTPITLLRLRAELMEDEAQQAKVLETLAEMEAMVASVLDFTKSTFHDEPQRQVDLAALVGSLCDDRADAGARVDFEAPGKVPYICRRMELKRALTNLIDNAIKYGGGARVTVDPTPAAIDVVIDDDGPGIPEDRMETIFMPFYRIDASRGQGGGVGLGLSIAQTIVHGHGGSIHLENRAGGGLRARVSLPV